MMECFGSSLMAREDALLLLLLTSILGSALGNTRYFTRMRTNASDLFKTKGENPRDEDERMIKDVASPQYDRRNSFVEASTFNPDVLNRFLEEYASKIKGTTDKNLGYPFKILKPAIEPLALEIDDETTQSPTAGYEQDSSVDETSNSTVNEEGLPDNLNDSIKRNKYYGANSHDDRNGWVTLEAIPWSKSKISKWQANPSTQRPWPEIKPWEKPTLVKPWTSDYSVRPIYDNNKPWYDKPKPTWPENANEKPWQKPTSRPSYYQDKYEESSNQNQKWPSERPSWNKYPGLSRPNSDIITDDRPTNFPNTWNKPQATKPSHQFADRYADKSQTEGSNENWQDFPSRYEQPNDRLRLTTERPSFSQYQYTNDHPPNHPANGDGQWVLLSTNRGYSKSKQRSIKIDAINPEAGRATNVTRPKRIREQEPTVAVMTSKRQIDGVTIDQRHQHHDVARRSAGSREDLQERRAESQGIRVRKTDYGANVPEEEAHSKYSHWPALELRRFGSNRGRHATSDHGHDDSDDLGTPKERRVDDERQFEGIRESQSGGSSRGRR
ncbi:hypothetical protein KM043_014036 [Ampulex compressa]|nr:hypothetical protein KM043_014036 [Ampulex compressa]